MSLTNWAIVFLLFALLSGLVSLTGRSRLLSWIARCLFGIFLLIAGFLFLLASLGIHMIA